MDNSNIKLLSMYYSTEKFLKTDLASPLLSAIRPVIGVEEHSYGLIVEKALPNLVSNINPEKLLAALRKKFTKIDSGEICPTKFVGHELTADQIVDQAKMHDTFNILYRTFFKELTIQRYEDVEFVRTNVAAKIAYLNKYFNDREITMLKNVFSDEHSRYPLSMDLDILIEIVDTMHEVTAITSSPAIADLVLSKAVMDTTKVSAEFDARIFL